MNYLELIFDEENIKIRFKNLIGQLSYYYPGPIECALDGLDDESFKFVRTYKYWKSYCEARSYLGGKEFSIVACTLKPSGMPSRCLDVTFQWVEPC